MSKVIALRPRVIRLDDLVKIIPVSQATIWRWVKDGKFPPPFKIGDNVTVWDMAEVNQFIAKAKNETTYTGEETDKFSKLGQSRWHKDSDDLEDKA